MFFPYVVTCEFFLSLVIPILLAIGVNRFIQTLWRNRFNSKPTDELKYKTESFRNPINLSVTIAGLLIPLVSALIAFLLTNFTRQQIESLSSIFAALCVLILSMCWGVWLSYSLATVSPDDDSIIITKTKNWKLPAHFAAQLSLLLTGTLLILIFLLFRFELPTKPEIRETSNRFNLWDTVWMRGTPEREIVYEMLRPGVYVGVPERVILEKWGQPDKAEKSVGESITRYVYISHHSTYIISCRDGAVLSFLIQKTENVGGAE